MRTVGKSGLKVGLVLATLLVFMLGWTALAALAQQTFSGDVVAASGAVTVEKDTVRTGNVRVDRGTVNVLGKVVGNVEVERGDVRVNGEVTGNVRLGSGKLFIGSAARIGGDVRVDRGTLVRSPQAQIGGSVQVRNGAQVAVHGLEVNQNGIFGPGFSINDQGVHLPFLSIDDEGIRFFAGEWQLMPGVRFWANGPGPLGLAWDSPVWTVGRILLRVFSWLGLFVMAAATLAIFPQPTLQVARTLANNPGRAGLFGLLVTFALPVAVVTLGLVLLFSIVGIPVLAIAVFAVPLAMLAAKLLGYVGLSLFIGRALGEWLPLLKSEAEFSFAQLLTGSLVLAVLGSVPFVHGLVRLVGGAMALGGVYLAFIHGRNWRRPQRVG